MKIFLTVIVIIAFFYYLFHNMKSGQIAQKNVNLGIAFLEANKKKEGVKSTKSGLQYKVLTPSNNTINPRATDTVTVHYHGTLIDETVFDSSIERGEPIAFALNQVITGWTEGLQLMVVGEKTRFYIASDLAYGNRKAGKIPPGSLLIFDVELLSIN